MRNPLTLPLLALALLGSGSGPALLAQSASTTVQPDCMIVFNFTAVANSPTSPNNGLDNRTLGCTTWQVSYSNSGFSAISLVLQSATDSSGSPGTYGNFSGTTLTGSNPNTSTTQAYSQFTGANPWVRVRLASVTGSGVVSGAAYGWRIPSANNATSGTAAVNLTQVGGAAIALGQTTMAASIPISIASNQSAIPVTTSGTQLVQPVCTSQASITLSGSGNTRIITGVSSQQIRVCHISFQTATPEDIKLTSGTGSNCGTGTANVTGLYSSTVGIALDTWGVLTAPSSADLCINQSAAQALGGVVVYSIF
jgi:hypothetical protein